MEHFVKSKTHHPRMNTNFRGGQMQTGFSFVPQGSRSAASGIHLLSIRVIRG